jgi:hypothetical protein
MLCLVSVLGRRHGLEGERDGHKRERTDSVSELVFRDFGRHFGLVDPFLTNVRQHCEIIRFLRAGCDARQVP